MDLPLTEFDSGAAAIKSPMPPVLDQPLPQSAPGVMNRCRCKAGQRRRKH